MKGVKHLSETDCRLQRCLTGLCRTFAEHDVYVGHGQETAILAPKLNRGFVLEASLRLQISLGSRVVISCKAKPKSSGGFFPRPRFK